MWLTCDFGRVEERWIGVGGEVSGMGRKLQNIYLIPSTFRSTTRKEAKKKIGKLK
jgi:hypothetical protein